MFLNVGFIYHLFLFLLLSVSLKFLFFFSYNGFFLQQQDHDRPSVKHRKSSFVMLERCKNTASE